MTSKLKTAINGVSVAICGMESLMGSGSRSAEHSARVVMQSAMDELRQAAATQSAMIETMRSALCRIASAAPAVKPEEESYDDMDSAYANGLDVQAWAAAEIALAAILEIKP